MVGVEGFARSAVKLAAAGVLRYTGLRRLMTRAARVASGGRRVLILSYHRVVEDFDAEASRAIPGLLLSRRTFERQLDDLADAGFEVVSMSRALSIIAGRERPRRDAAVLTFDDGYRDVYEHAYPVLKARGLPATVYLASSFVGSQARFPHDRLFHLFRLALAGRSKAGGRNVVAPGSLEARAAVAVDDLIAREPAQALLQLIARMEEGLGGGTDVVPPSGEVLTWEMAREMSGNGFEIGAHTVHHVVLTHESDESVDREIAASKKEIEERIGRPVLHFAYPNGFYDRRVVRALVRHGFRSAVTTEDLPNRVGGDPFRLRRKTLWENYSRGPFGYSSTLTACHLDSLFTMLSLARPVRGEQPVSEALEALEARRTSGGGMARA